MAETGTTALVDGRPADSLDLADRGLNYGDGLFETIAVRDGRPELLEAHLTRLFEGCARLGIEPPGGDVLRAETRVLCEGVPRAVLKILVTRGSGGRGYAPGSTAPRRILRRLPWPEESPPPPDGIAMRVCRQRLASNPALAGIKHLNRLEQVLARAEWDDPGIAEGLMLSLDGRIIEGVSSNVFFERRGTLVTPDIRDCGVAGVMRAEIMRLAAELGIHCEARDVPFDELHAFDGCFVCNSLTALRPVSRIGSRGFEITALIRSLGAALDARLGRTA